MDIIKQMHEENAKYDPHGFKAQGANSPKHSHQNAPYKHEKFPQMVYKADASKIVGDEDELAAALGEGWSEEAPKPSQE